ncbi:acetyl-coenzyme A transporter 1-domain-containing protein [Ephemerocybe angulata]|uniref:Acetyl-coenzyme A transporter 1-domain-containing protein n=1 Tax=Ephemerocybe angulata TaxID=980116 RepID=A0A8H6IJ56_9AGAR|nr:acetyl-coenzyme A transporter 1-domain-containing protein [Tulosesus angulatus]
MPRKAGPAPMAVTSSLNSIHISPRTPKTPRVAVEDEGSDVEMELLNEEERYQADRDVDEPVEHAALKKPISAKDKRSMVLLCVLYLIQGVPLGLALGSVPFILKEHLSYSQLATFALSSYPYSLKLLWSPIVDAIFFKRIGRRKSWIIPMQLIVGSLMLYISLNVEKLMEDPSKNLTELTVIFTMLVSFSATQDIAVDGWALTLLSQDCLSYASTCQTIGLNTGFFASFTVFLAFNSEAFAHKWGLPVLTLGAYLRFWSVICYTVTVWLLFFKKEDKEAATEADMSIKGVYKTIWTICKLKHVQLLVMVHLFAKVGFVAHEATSLKMVEKGLKREDLAVAVLIDFPFQILGGWLAAKWSRGDKPLRPWLYAFWPRYLFGVISVLTVHWFPKPPISGGFFTYLIAFTVISSFTSTVQFVGISAFHTRVSDPLIGGTYMTLLNTFTNLGGTWPKWFVLKGVDLFTIANCEIPDAGSKILIKAKECVSEVGKHHCKSIGGNCVIERDGYYIVTTVCMGFGVLFLIGFIVPAARKLQALPTSAWRLKQL